ncbi:FYVE zinc finger-domain-containing protein [Blakeslea trispora]|nr:FYVE zinc finger-domain-containing protein [Blakeslea trispora]
MTDTESTGVLAIPTEETDMTETIPHHRPHSPTEQQDHSVHVSSESEEDVTEERVRQPALLPRSQRVWEMDRQAPECRRCYRRFNFLVRRHHCRRCGQIVCDRCSSNRLKLPVEELVEDPIISLSQYPYLATQTQRVCDSCFREPMVENRRRRATPTDMRRTNSAQSLMIDCPVCGRTFLGMQKYQQEAHLQQCLNIGSPPVQSPRYIVYELSSDSAQIGDECPICFDEFNQGDQVSRMICLCSYHQACLASWLQRGKGCPVHYDSIQI